MAVKLRLARAGAKRKPIYRIVAADGRAKRDGRFIEQLGQYNPNLNPPAVTLKQDRVDYWVSHGAQISDTVKRVLINQKRAAEATAS